MRGSMAVDVITTPAELLALETDWRDLWHRTPDATPFQSPMWCLPWWRAFGSGELYVIVTRDGERIDGIAPLFVVREDDESLGMIIGTGNSDYGDVLGPAERVLDAIKDVDCQLWDLQQLRPSSALLAARTPDGWTDNIAEHDVCPILAIDGAGDDLENLISTHSRKKLRYYRRSLDRLGNVSIETPDATTIDAFMNALFDLHAARWQRRGLPGVLATDVDQRFQREAARALLDAGALRMYATRVGDRIVAIFYGFAARDTVYYYLSGYDPDLEKLSIGTVIVAHAIEQAVRSGAKVFDFLRGAEQYKYTWGAQDRPNQRRQLFRS